MDYESLIDLGSSFFYLVFSVVFRFIWGFVCKKIVDSKGYYGPQNKGFWWGFFLTWIGLIFCLCKKREELIVLYS